MYTKTTQKFDLSPDGLTRLSACGLFMAEINPLDFWQGLLSFLDVGDQVWESHSYLEDQELMIRVKTELALERLTERFLFACPYANSKNDLRCCPAIALLPADCSTLIAGVIFKLDNNGTTYICYPREYHTFWASWFCMTATDTYDLIAF